MENYNEEDIFDENYKKNIDKIKNNNSGFLINILSIMYYILSVISLLIGIVYTFETGFLALIIGIAVAVTFVLFAIILKMFYEIHFVITHLKDSIK